MSVVPDMRVRAMNSAPVRSERDYVLYWMIAFRRTRSNFSLDRAVEWAAKLQKPLIVFEPLSCSYPWASDRFHQFVLDGMEDNSRTLAKSTAFYFPYIEPKRGAAKGLLKALAARACVVVTDDYPVFFLPKIVRAAAAQLDVQLEAVDSNGLLPLTAASRAYPTAASFRRHVQRTLRRHLKIFPSENAFAGVRIPRLTELPAAIRSRWPAAKGPLSSLPIDHTVLPVKTRGGMVAAKRRLLAFLSRHIDDYSSRRNLPDADITSNLSPYLHFGHISVHEVFTAIARRDGWSPEKLGGKPAGKRLGWWNMKESAEEFLDQIVTWRELGFNFAAHRNDYDRYDSLPAWAQATLKQHAIDRREPHYSLRQFESARTYDSVWNAAQRQLIQEGRIHNYMRMLWGKKILEWSASPERALEIMIELNNKYALDGRDPNSYSGIFWILGRYDRPWPERPIFGKIRYMSSESAKRKFGLKLYLKKYAS